MYLLIYVDIVYRLIYVDIVYLLIYVDIVYLLIYVDVPSKVWSEVLQLRADVLLHHGHQRDPELLQLRLQRGQLRGLLQEDTQGHRRR